MGIISWIKRKSESVSEKASETWKDFTGQSDFEKADKLYDEITEKFNKHKQYFEEQVETLSQSIENSVDSINTMKKVIKTTLFPEFAQKISRIKGVDISKDFDAETFLKVNYEFDTFKGKDELFLIDFKKQLFKNNALAIISLGFYTRKKAKQTLIKVQEEAERLKEEMEKMSSELIRLQLIDKALSTMKGYFEKVSATYKNMLKRLDNSYNFLISKSIIEHSIIECKLSAKHLPYSQQRELKSIVDVSLILKTMVEIKILIEGNKQNLKKQEHSFKTDFAEKIESLYNAA